MRATATQHAARWGGWLWVPLAYVALTLALTWPLAARLGSAFNDWGDPQLQAWIIAWDAHALRSGAWSVWQAPIFYPYPDTLAYSDHHLFLALFAAPVIWATGNAVLAYNLLVIASFALTGWAVYSLVFDSTRARGAAFVGGLIFAFCAFRIAQIVHLQLLQTAWLPWALLFERRLLRQSGRARDALLFGVFGALQCVTSLYYAFFAIAVLGGYALFWLAGTLARARQASARWSPRMLAARLALLLLGAAVAALLVAPLTLPYLRVYRTLGIVRSTRELDNWSAPLRSYLAVPRENRLLAALGWPTDTGEFVLFPGITASALALVAIATLLFARTKEPKNREPRTERPPHHTVLNDGRAKDPKNQEPSIEEAPHQKAFSDGQRMDIIFWLLVACAALVLSLGTGVRWVRGGALLPIPLPYALLYSYVPGFGALRVPARWGMLVALSVAVLAGIGLARLERGDRGQGTGDRGQGTGDRGQGTGDLSHQLPITNYQLPITNSRITLVALALVLLESFSAPLPTTDPARLASVPPVYPWLAAQAQRDIGVVLELPVGRVPRGAELDRIIWRQWYQTLHWKTLPVGYSGLIPFGTTDLLGIVQRLPDAGTLRYLQLLGVDTLVIHRDEYDAAKLKALLAAFDGTPLLRRRASVGAATVYTLQADRDVAELPRAGGAIYISNDERVPGLLALALTRRWQAQQFTLYGGARTRYYGALGSAQAGQVYDYGLLAADENPLRAGFAATGRRWARNGLALYARDPALRASLTLGQVPPGAFQPVFPERLDLLNEAGRLAVGAQTLALTAPLTQTYLELDLASLVPQTIQVGATSRSVAAGVTTISAPLPAGATTISGQPGATALLRVRVRAAPGADALAAAPAVSAQTSFDGATLRVAARVGGAARLLLAVQGAAAYDDRPVRLVSGVQPVAADGRVTFALNLLAPAAAWVAQHEAPVDGRYIAYLKPADRPDAPGLPVAQFSIRNGAIVDAQPVPLPLTALE